MPRHIIKIEDKYCEWSTVTDAPVTLLMTLKEFKEYYSEKYGYDGIYELKNRLERVEKTGASCRKPFDLDSLICCNRCGEWIHGWEGKDSLTTEQISHEYRNTLDYHPHNKKE